MVPRLRGNAFDRLFSGRAALALLVAATVVAYSSSITGDFQFDDEVLVHDPAIRDLPARAAAFVPALLAGGRSVVELSFAANYAIGRLDPLVFHLTNLLVHLTVVLLVHALTRETLARAGYPRTGGLSVAVAALFALHPLQTQAVTYISQRAESLGSLWYVAALLLLLVAERDGWSLRGGLAYAGATAAFVAGGATKPLVVTLPLVYVAYGTVFPGQGDPGGWAGVRRRVVLIGPWLAVGALMAARFIRSLEGRIDAGWSVPAIGPARYLLSQPRAIVSYLRLLLFPVGQSIEHDIRPVASGDAIPTVACALLLAALAALGAWLLSRARRAGADAAAGMTARVAGFGILWFFVVIAPSSSLMPIADVMVEHRAYLASWGILVAAASGAALAVERLARARKWATRAGTAAAFAVCAILAAATYARNLVWQTRLSMWTDAVEKSPRSSRTHSNLAFAMIQADQPERAVEEYRAAKSFSGDGRTPEPQIVQNLGATLMRLGRVPEALAVLTDGSNDFPTHAGIVTNLAMCQGMLGSYDDALATARRAVEISPSSSDAHAALGLALFYTGDTQGGLSQLEKAVALQPDDPGMHMKLAFAYERIGAAAAACDAYRRLQQVPSDAATRIAAMEATARLRCGAGP